MQILELHLSEVTLFAATAKFPTSTFKEESIDVGTFLGEVWEFVLVLGVEDLSDQAHVIEWQKTCSGRDLHNGSQVRHRVE